MANRSGTDRAGRGYPRQPPGLVNVTEQNEGDDEASGPIELDSRGSAWERMLEALGSNDGADALEDGLEALRASIAERLRTHNRSSATGGESQEARLRPARRRRRRLARQARRTE